MIDFSIKPEAIDKLTIEEATRHETFIRDLNYLINEGFIEVEETDDVLRLYPK